MNKYEKLIDLIINEDEEKAKGLFHEIVVEKSKTIYESLMDDEIAEEISDDEVGDLANDIEADEEGVNEEDDELDAELDSEGADDLEGPEMADMGDDMGVDDIDVDDEVSGDDEAPATKGDGMDSESAIDELKAEFDKIMSTVDTDSDGDHDMDDHEDSDADADVDGDDMEMEVEPEVEEEGIQFEAEETDVEAVDESEEMADADEDEDETLDEDDDNGQDELDKLREYVEKVAGVPNTGGADNNSSVVAGKNDMGGTSANIAKGGDEAGGKVASPKVDSDGNVNVPGGKASKLSSAPKPKTAS